MHRCASRLLAAFAALATLSALAQSPGLPSGLQGAATPSGGGALARVNGIAIPAARAEQMVRELTGQGRPDNAQLRQLVRDELVNREIMAQAAAKQGLDKSADVVSQLDNLRQQLLVRAYIQDHFRKNPIADAEVRAEYDKIRKELGEREFKARHILVKGEDEARAIITRLKSGAKFEELAKQSEDPGSKNNGGDLDWARPANYVPEFARALSALKKGETTDAPVKTQFGFHVIRLDDVREAKLPSIDEARPQLTDRLQRQKLDRLLADLRKGAKIE